MSSGETLKFLSLSNSLERNMGTEQSSGISSPVFEKPKRARLNYE